MSQSADFNGNYRIASMLIALSSLEGVSACPLGASDVSQKTQTSKSLCFVQLNQCLIV